MDSQTLEAHAISEKSRAERLYLHYTLTLATLFALGGAILAVLALGDWLRVITRDGAGIDVRLLNAAPGFALCLGAAILFAAGRPRRPRRLPASSPSNDEIELRIQRAISARMAMHDSMGEPTGRDSRPPKTMLHHVAGSLANALEQSALEALSSLQKEREAPIDPDRVKPKAAVNGDT